MDQISDFINHQLYKNLRSSSHLDSHQQMVSDINRYKPIATVIRRLFNPTERLRIADFNTASGEAILGLLLSLSDYKIALDIFDKSPSAVDIAKRMLINKGKGDAITKARSRDLIEPADTDLSYDVGVIGHVHYYLESSQLAMAIRERLQECRYLFVCPATNHEPTEWAEGGALSDSRKMYSARMFYLDADGKLQTEVISEMIPLGY